MPRKSIDKALGHMAEGFVLLFLHSKALLQTHKIMNTLPISASQFFHHLSGISVEVGMIHQSEHSCRYVNKCALVAFVSHAADSKEAKERIYSAQRNELITQIHGTILKGKA